MELLKKLENCNISFHIHLLEKEDFILIGKANEKKHIVYILDGITRLTKVFSNNERICIKLLHSRQVVNISKECVHRQNYYNVLTAITATKIIVMPAQAVKIVKTKSKTDKTKTGIICQQNNSSEIVSILSHRNTKKRISQLLIILVKQFGKIKGRMITIPFYLSQQAIAEITGSQRGTVSKIMNSLKRNKTISYGSKSIIIHNLVHLIQD